MLRNDAFIAGNNGEERTVKMYLKQWRAIPRQMGMAAGGPETGGFPDPNGEWRKNDL